MLIHALYDDDGDDDGNNNNSSKGPNGPGFISEVLRSRIVELRSISAARFCPLSVFFLFVSPDRSLVWPSFARY